jgi:hypothetical protein
MGSRPAVLSCGSSVAEEPADPIRIVVADAKRQLVGTHPTPSFPARFVSGACPCGHERNEAGLSVLVTPGEITSQRLLDRESRLNLLNNPEPTGSLISPISSFSSRPFKFAEYRGRFS